VDTVVPGVQSVLVDVGLHDRVGLDIHGIPTAVGLDTEGKVSVGINVPEKTAEEPEAAVSVAECGVSYSLNPKVISISGPLFEASLMQRRKPTGSLDAPVRRQLGGDAAVEARMCRGIRCGIRGFKVQARSAETADGAVGHGLAALD
jgi:hypothetical protein